MEECIITLNMVHMSRKELAWLKHHLVTVQRNYADAAKVRDYERWLNEIPLAKEDNANQTGNSQAEGEVHPG